MLRGKNHNALSYADAATIRHSIGNRFKYGFSASTAVIFDIDETAAGKNSNGTYLGGRPCSSFKHGHGDLSVLSAMQKLYLPGLP